MNVVAIIQARMGSTRLPGKAMLPLAGKPMITRLVERVVRAKTLTSVVLAYPFKDHADMIAALNQRDDPGYNQGVGVYASKDDENDLVARYLSAAQAHHADVIVRIPGDNPCVDPAYIDQAVKTYLHEPHIYYSNTTDLCGEHNAYHGWWLDGIGAEVFSVSRLQWLDAKLSKGDVYYREHPHAWFLDHRLYDLHQADYRLDVNDQNDYEFISSIYAHCYPSNHEFGANEIVEFLNAKKSYSTG